MNEDLQVPLWWTVPDIVGNLGQTLLTVRRWIEDREIIGVRRGDNHAFAVPAAFFGDTGPLVHLKGTFTVLADGGMNDSEIIAWLFEPDESLPVDGAPIDAIRAGFKTEVRRRAMESAF